MTKETMAAEEESSILNLLRVLTLCDRGHRRVLVSERWRVEVPATVRDGQGRVASPLCLRRQISIRQRSDAFVRILSRLMAVFW